MTPNFTVKSLGKDQYTIDEGGKTIAIVTSQGFVDWLIYEPAQKGELITTLYKETHLCWTLGLKFELTMLSPNTEPVLLTCEVTEGGAEARLHCDAVSTDGVYGSIADARLFLADDGRYRWDLVTSMRNLSDKPVDLAGFEFNNVYPSKAGRCMLYAPTKEYSSTVMTDSDGVVWRFPHQHMLGYTDRINTIRFAEGTSAGFAGEPGGNPTVDIREASHQPNWAICDMYYDLHCCGLLSKPLAPGESIRYAYTVRYMSPADSQALDSKARPLPITDQDWLTHEYPRIDLGMNRFTNRCELDRMDDCSGFRPSPPDRVWDREVGNVARGSLRLTNASAEQAVWSAEPPTMIPAATTLGITANIKTECVTGKGAFVRVRYHTFHWHPQPHVEWVRDLESVPITGTTDGWVQVTVPALHVEDWEKDYLIWLDVILEGEGVAWFTDVDVDLVNSFKLDPTIKLTRPLVTA